VGLFYFRQFSYGLQMILLLLTLAFAHSQNIPLESIHWQALKFSKIPSNQVEFIENTLKVSVDSSASPLLHPLASPKKLKKIDLEVKIEGTLNKADSNFPEDSPLRLGLVLEGSNRPSSMQLLFSPDWIKTLMRLAPPDSGIEQLFFHLFTNHEFSEAKERQHPSSKLIKEKIEGQILAGDFQKISIPLNHPQNILAIWLSIDGDDTKSKYSIQIRDLKVIE